MKLTEEQRQYVEDNHNLIYWYIQLRHLDTADWYDALAIELCHSVIQYDHDKGSISNYFKIRADNLVKKEYVKQKLKKSIPIDPLQFKDEVYDTYSTDTSLEKSLEIEELFSGKNGAIFRLKSEGYTQSEIAEKLGITQSYVSKIIEKKRREYYGLDR